MPVPGLTDVVAIAAGANHSLAVKSDGTLRTWGRNSDGQLGDGTTTRRTSPVAVSGLTGVSQVAGGLFHSLALKTDGTVWAWGDNFSGQIGDGSFTDRPTPVQVPGLSNMRGVAGTGQHSMAYRSDGTVWAWGANAWGNLGDGTTTSRRSPIQVQGLDGVIAIAGGGSFSLAVDSPAFPVPTATPTQTSTPTLTTTPSLTSVITATRTPTGTVAAASTPTRTSSPTLAATQTPTLSPTVSPTPTLPVIAGRGLTLEADTFTLRWRDGTQPTGILVMRYSASRGLEGLAGLLVHFPSYTDPSPLNEASCYLLLLFGGDPPSTSQFLGFSDFLCLYPDTGGGTMPTQFRIALNESTRASLSWTGPGGHDDFELETSTFNGPLPQTRVLPGSTISTTEETGGVTTCYQVHARSAGARIGSTRRVCAVPNVAFFPAGDPESLDTGIEHLRARMEAMR